MMGVAFVFILWNRGDTVSIIIAVTAIILTAIVAFGRYRKEGDCPLCGKGFEIWGQMTSEFECTDCKNGFWVYSSVVIEKGPFDPKSIARAMASDEFFDELFHSELETIE